MEQTMSEIDIETQLSMMIICVPNFLGMSEILNVCIN